MAKKPRADEPSEPKNTLKIGAEGTAAENIIETLAEQKAARARGAGANGDMSKADQVIELLKSPRNSVVVRRTSPKNFNGQNVAIEVYIESCPLRLEDIKREVFEAHGGHQFQVRVLDEDGKTLDALVITNPDERNPVIVNTEEGDGLSTPVRLDPIDEDLEQAEKEEELARKQEELERRRARIRELRDNRGARGADPEIEALRQQVKGQADALVALGKQKETDTLNARLDRLEATISTIGKGSHGDAEKDALLKRIEKLETDRKNDLVALLMTDQNKLVNTLITTITKPVPATNAPDEDKIIEKLAKLKALFGNNSDKASRLEDLMWDIAEQQLAGGARARPSGEEDEEDPENIVKFFIKQAMPLAKKYVDKQIEKDPVSPGGKQYTEQELEAMIKARANEIGMKAANTWIAEQKAKRAQLPPGQPRPPQPPPPRPPAGAPPAAPPQSPPGANPPPQPPPSAGPRPPEQYDRRKAVNSVLETLWAEINDPKNPCPRESLALGDACAIWDDELKDAMLKVDSGEGLEATLKPYAEPELWAQIMARTKSDDKVKRWVRDLVDSLQQVWGEQREARGRVDAPPQERF